MWLLFMVLNSCCSNCRFSFCTGYFVLQPATTRSTSWVVKRKFLHKNFTKVEKQLSISSVSTEEEDLQDSDAEQDMPCELYTSIEETGQDI